MNPLNLDEVREYVNENVVDFHQRRIRSLEELRLEKLLTKNPYLFKAKNIITASELITGLLEAFLSSSEETSYVRGYLKVVGQNFWYLISENRDLYTDIIEPIGHKAKEHNETFLLERSRVINRFTKLFIDKFCDDIGTIDWVKLVEFNSGNYDLDKFLP
jgi:hypothetical protein